MTVSSRDPLQSSLTFLKHTSCKHLILLQKNDIRTRYITVLAFCKTKVRFFEINNLGQFTRGLKSVFVQFTHYQCHLNKQRLPCQFCFQVSNSISKFVDFIELTYRCHSQHPLKQNKAKHHYLLNASHERLNLIHNKISPFVVTSWPVNPRISDLKF